jgi:predicted house-cleaning noncanonical NTP pyrophosphatase (MazG superfamily)
LTIYNKAIRDKIPEIIKESGKNCNVRILDDLEFLKQLEKKLSEELIEYQECKNADELSDILEIIYRISELKGISPDGLNKIRADKAKKRGKFDGNLFLVDVDE